MKGERERGGRYDRRRVRGDRQDIPVESSDSVMFYRGRLRPDEGVLRPELSHPGSCVQVSLSRVRESSSDEEALARERASELPSTSHSYCPTESYVYSILSIANKKRSDFTAFVP